MVGTTEQNFRHPFPRVSVFRTTFAYAIVFVVASAAFTHIARVFYDISKIGLTANLALQLLLPGLSMLGIGVGILWFSMRRAGSYQTVAVEVPFLAIEALEEHGPAIEALPVLRTILNEYLEILANSLQFGKHDFRFRLGPFAEVEAIVRIVRLLGKLDGMEQSKSVDAASAQKLILGVGQSLVDIHIEMRGKKGIQNHLRRFSHGSPLVAELRNKCQRMIGQFQDEFEALKTSKSDSELQRDLKFQRACMTSRLVYIYATVAFEACMDREFKVLMANFLVMVMTVKTDLEEFSKSCEKESDSKRMCGYVKNMGRRHRTLSDLYGLSEKKREIGDVISDVLQDLRQVSERAGNFWDGNGKLAKYRALM